MRVGSFRDKRWDEEEHLRITTIMTTCKNPDKQDRIWKLNKHLGVARD